MGRRDEWGIDEEIQVRILTGDAYPSYMRMLQQMGRTKVGSAQSVNVAGAIGRTKTDWIGLKLAVMCPDEPTAREVLPAIIAVLQSYGFTGTAKQLAQQLRGVEEYTAGQSQIEESELWPDGAGDLLRDGVRPAQVQQQADKRCSIKSGDLAFLGGQWLRVHRKDDWGPSESPTTTRLFDPWGGYVLHDSDPNVKPTADDPRIRHRFEWSKRHSSWICKGTACCPCKPTDAVRRRARR